MLIQVNSDNNITATEGLSNYVSGAIEDSLSRFNEQVTRVEVHLGDENGDKGGDNDKRCMIEARLAGMQPVAVTAHAATLDQAIHDAIAKMKAALDKTLGRLVK